MKISANPALGPDAAAAAVYPAAASSMLRGETDPAVVSAPTCAPPARPAAAVSAPPPAALSHTIIILSRDRPGLLPRAVATALQALGQGGEILVVDDGSQIPATEVLSAVTRPALRILRHRESVGISAARNAGIAAARGEVIFFLDDDDELQPDYIRTILSGPALQFDYGFSACNLVQGTKIKAARPRFATGPVPASAALRRKICGMGMGFWIRAEIARATGPFATALRINEDTDYLCQLILSGRRAWYSATAGVNVHTHSHSARNSGNITRSISAAERARDMRFVCDRYPQFAAHLGRSYLRHCAKAGLINDAKAYLRPLTSLRLRIGLTCYFHAKFVLYRKARRA